MVNNCSLDTLTAVVSNATECKFDFTYQRIAPVHGIYVGSDATGKIAEYQRQWILDRCAVYFQSFTCLNAVGYFLGKSEETMLLQVATEDGDLVRKLAAELARGHSQLGVGVLQPDQNGVHIYGRIIPRQMTGQNPDRGVKQ